MWSILEKTCASFNSIFMPPHIQTERANCNINAVEHCVRNKQRQSSRSHSRRDSGGGP